MGRPTVRVVGTGLIYGAIVAVWAAFLVPWALRRYDEAAHTRSIEKFSAAMRVLGRRDASESSTAIAPRGLAPPEQAPTSTPTPHPTRAAARAAAQRRRRTLWVLFATTALVTVLAALSVVPLWAILVPLLLVGAFLVACRRQVRREDEALWDRQPPARPATERQPVGSSAVRRAARVDSAYGSQLRPMGSEPDDELTVVLSAGALVQAEAVAVPVATDDGTSLWDPLPVTLPTYVSKPRAARTIRTIDLGEPGTWTSGHVEGEQTTMPEPADKVEEKAPEKRAVGG